MDPLQHLYDAKCMDNVRDKFRSPYANKEGVLNGFIPVVCPNDRNTLVILQCNYRIMWNLRNHGFPCSDDPEFLMPSEDHCYGKTPFECLQKVVAWRGNDFLDDIVRMQISWLDRYGKEGGSCKDGFHLASCVTVPIPLRTDDIPQEDFYKTIELLKSAA